MAHPVMRHRVLTNFRAETAESAKDRREQSILGGLRGLCGYRKDGNPWQ
jgi:hypothetical protein